MTLRALVAAPLIAVTVLCVSATPQESPAVPADAFAVVGSATVTRAQVKSATLRGTPAQTLQRLVQAEFLRVNLERDGVDVDALSDAEFKAGLDEVKEQLRKNTVDFATMLERSGQTREQFEEAFRYSVALMKHVRASITEAGLRAYFAANKLRLGGELRASHLFVKITKSRDAAAAEARAVELLATLQQQALKDERLEPFFVELAGKESDDPMAALTGGDLDWFNAKGRAGVPIPVLMSAFTHGKLGLVPEPQRSRDGWHVVLITAVRLPASVTFESLRPTLEERVTAERAQALLATWRARTPIRFADDAPGKPGTGNR